MSNELIRPDGAPDVLPQEETQAVVTPTQLVLKRFKRNKLALVGIAILILMALFALVGPFLSPYGEYQIFYELNGQELTEANPDISQAGILLYKKAPPSERHLLGTDRDGRDVLTRLMYGGRVSLSIGFACIILELLLGVFLGGLSGYFGKWIDMLIMRVVDIFFCIPYFPVVLIVSSVLMSMKFPQEYKIYILMIAIAFFGWSGVARLVRGQILSLREQEYMLAAESTGLPALQRIFKHLIPNVMPQLIVVATLGIGDIILFESSLSFLGLGVPFPLASWGNMVNAVNDPVILQNNLNIWVPPGLCILLTVMAFNFVGDGLRDAFDPKMKR